LGKGMSEFNIIMVAVEGRESNIIYNYLSQKFSIGTVIIENKISKKKLIRNRIKKLGFFKVIGQLFFQVFLQKSLSVFSKNRISEIITSNGLEDTPIPPAKIFAVNSINETTAIEKIQNLNPSLIIVNGTRIIAKKVLDNCHAKFINMHMGITPKYRGVHGAYWALVSNDRNLCGVTVHFIDAGIDTGSVLKQDIIKPKQEDNFTTYPYLQLVAGLPLLLKTIQEVKDNTIKEVSPLTLESKLWYHPTFYEYCKNRIFRKIK
jgi:folate-dependent phosphoribosylglycinamide formyltransferase PurN